MAIEILDSNSFVFELKRGNVGTVSDIVGGHMVTNVRGLNTGGGIAIKIDDKTAIQISDNAGLPVKGIIRLV